MSLAITPASRPVSVAGPYRLPERLGPFTVRAQVGWGGTAFTFVGSEPGPSGAARLKCLKIPSPQLLMEHSPREIRDIFDNEAAVLRLLPPANIAPLERVVELGDGQGIVCLVYTFIDGADLGRVIRKSYERRELLPWQAVVGIARDLAGALEEAHTDRRAENIYYNHPCVVHRDIAPSNVMLDIRGNAFLIDFGFARTMNTSRLRASRAHPGRIAYSAPEYFGGDGGGIYDPRLDLFSTGALLFEALTGRQAFRGSSVNEHIEQVQTNDRPRIEDLRPEFNGPSGVDPELVSLAGIVDCLLEPDPDARFQSAGALLSALSSLRVGMDQRPLGAMVIEHQDAWQHRVTTSLAIVREFSDEDEDPFPSTNPCREAIDVEQPSGVPPRRAHRGRMASIAIAVLLVASIFLLGSVDTFWVPLLTGQLGWTVFDAFWTPFLTRLGTLGLAVAMVGGISLGLVWARGRRSNALRAHLDREPGGDPH